MDTGFHSGECKSFKKGKLYIKGKKGKFLRTHLSKGNSHTVVISLFTDVSQKRKTNWGF